MTCFFYVSLNYLSGQCVKGYAQTSYPSAQSINGQAFSKQVMSFFNHLVKLSEPRSDQIFKKYRPVVAKELDMENLYVTTYQELKNLLDSAANESIDVLTLFTLPVLQEKKNKAIVLDRDMLSRLNIHYNLHGIFLISTPSAEDDSAVQMSFLITGQGKLIVGYDRNTIIWHPEYSFATGKYKYQELFLMDAKTDDKGNYGLFNIKGLSNPSDGFQQMRGPLNSKIRSLSLLPDFGNEKKILVYYEFIGTGKKIVARIPIEKLYKETK